MDGRIANHKKYLYLVMPPQQGLLEGFSSALVALAGYVRHELPEVDLRIVDLSNVAPDDLPARVGDALGERSSCAETFVGITTSTASYRAALRTAAAIRTQAPEAVVIFGGHHASAQPEQVLRRHQTLVDGVVVGEGERALVELLKTWPDRAEVSNLAFLDGDQLKLNQPAPLLDESSLDLVPALLEDQEFGSKPGKFGHVTYVSARGCPLRCSFCSVANQAIRAKSIDAVVRDVKKLVGAGFSRIAIEDNFFAHSPRRTREICTALAELRDSGVSFAWDCQTRVESLSPEIVDLMSKGGCDAVYIGVESVLPNALRHLGKTTRPDRYLERLRHIVLPAVLRSPIACYLNLQLGLPRETSRDNEETLSILRQIGLQAASQGLEITIFPQLHVVYPGTAHFFDGVAQGRFPHDIFESFTAWEAEEEPILRWLGEHFAHGVGGLPIGILKPVPLRAGTFRVDPEAVMRISATLTALGKLSGITVFDYVPHLSKSSRTGFVPEGPRIVAPENHNEEAFHVN